MPQFIAGLVLPFLVNSPVFFLGPAAVSATATGIGYLATAAGLYGLQSALTPKPDVPKPEDGKYNLRQAVPSPAIVLGTTKKSSDYLALEEKDGIAAHVFAVTGHRISRHVAYYLHDELVTLDPVTGEVIAPDHFDEKVIIRSRVGLNAETAYGELVSLMPTIWTPDHRGDGMATTLMLAESVDATNYQKRFPNGMPLLTEVVEGAMLYDPRKPGHSPSNPATWEYSENLALQRAWHLTHPVGGKIAKEDMHWPDWSHAADVCDELVTNRIGEQEPRYHGGMWFRAKDAPVEVGRIMDQAAELVIYETPDGKIGVHAGEYVAPDIRLTEADIRSVSVDMNLSRASTVLAVRGRFTDPALTYNTADAAIVGNPYLPEDDTERTRTVDNQAVQRHNHIQRLQALALIRANAPRVHFVADYEPARMVPYRRFIRAHCPPKLDEAVIEIIGRPRLSLKNLTYEVEGIVVPPTLFAFTAATDEGDAPPVIPELEHGGIPVPSGFDVVIQREVVGGGRQAAYALADWTAPASAALTTEIEWQPVAGGPAQSVMAQADETAKRTSYLADGVSYRLRARHWSAGEPGGWTAYVVRAVVADTSPPSQVTGASATGGAGTITFTWTSPNSGNYKAARLWVNTVNTFGTATLAALKYGAPGAGDGWVLTGIAAGTRYTWIDAINFSDVPASPPVTTGPVTVT